MKKRIISFCMLLALFLTLLPVSALAAADGSQTLTVGCSPFTGKFSPFLAQTAEDQDVVSMTQLGLLTTDRTGAVVLKGIKGETIAYNGTPYTYYGPADLTITENADGTVDYDFVLRNDLVFSDGERLTVDDVIFSLYVLLDPTYDGSSTLYSYPIEGLEAYRSGMVSRGSAIFAAGQNGYAANSLYTREQYNTFWQYYNEQAGVDFAQEIVDYCMANYASYGAVDVATAAALWGYDLPAGATAADFWDAILTYYDGDVEVAEAVESAGSTLFQLTVSSLGSAYQAGVQTGASAPNISGIRKTGDNSLRIRMTQLVATAIYQLGISIAPMHYYGDKSLYNYDNNQFGFPKGDLSGVRAKAAQPMGAGPYKFVKYENGAVSFEANANYFKGAPKTKNVVFVQQTVNEVSGIVYGAYDIVAPAFSDGLITNIEWANGGSLTGEKITTYTVDNLGYGYIGQNAIRVSVGNDPASEASRNLRKAFATIFAVYREVSVDSYYGDRASVINYPLSNTSWAAPRPADDGYKVAFSVDVNGNDIYTPGMSAEEKYAAAKEAALGFFEAAGYTVADGKVTVAPAGAKMEYTFWIPGNGVGDHPAYLLVYYAAQALAELGIRLNIRDIADSQALWDGLDAFQVDMWAAAWGVTVDPDMYQLYYADVANAGATLEGQNPLGGLWQGGSNYEYCIADPELDQLILDARSTTNQEYRKAMYRACLDIILDWAVEIPTYQRQNAVLFSTERVDTRTVTPDITPFYGWMSEIENLRLRRPFSFDDVPETAWYSDAVAWAVRAGVTNGVSETSFAPDAACNRAQIVTFIWRAAGCPEPTSLENPFTDVSANDFCYKAVLWAAERGITTGVGNGLFGKDVPCDRAQVVTFLWRAHRQPSAAAAAFADVPADAWYADAVNWAVSRGITTGVSATEFSPNTPCSRAQAVTFLFRDMAR